MKITAVHYSALANTGNYENEKVGLDAQVEPGETVEQVVEVLKDRVFAMLDRSDLLQQRRELQYEVEDLENQVKDARDRWEQTATFLKAQGLRPDAPDFPSLTRQLPAPSERVVAQVVEDGEIPGGIRPGDGTLPNNLTPQGNDAMVADLEGGNHSGGR